MTTTRHTPATRRQFLAALPLAAVAVLITLRPNRAVGVHTIGSPAPAAARHPDPRPGIDARNVLTADQLADAPHVIELYDNIREIPHIADGIHCYCGCAMLEGYRSLLTCYEQEGMSKYCEICQGQGRLAYSRWKEGQSLDQIRRATDARFGRAATATNSLTAHADCGSRLTTTLSVEDR
jgi:hypothetical protein